jgi:hypothetical protein
LHYKMLRIPRKVEDDETSSSYAATRAKACFSVARRFSVYNVAELHVISFPETLNGGNSPGLRLLGRNHV